MDRSEDLKKEISILQSLEKIRNTTMDMESSDELKKVVGILNDEISRFQLAEWGCNIQIMHDSTEEIEIWLSGSGNNVFDQSFFFRKAGHSVIKKQWERWRNQFKSYHISLSGKKKNNYDNYLFKHTDFVQFPDELKNQIRSQSQVHFSFARMKYGNLVSINESGVLSKGQLDILKRFAKVFEQAYTRFIDFKKLEDQARESRIEASLERIRSAALSMQEPQDMLYACRVMSNEMKSHGVENIRNIQTCIFHPLNKSYQNYQYYTQYDQSVVEVIEYEKNDVIQQMVGEIKDDTGSFYSNSMSGKQLEEFIAYRIKNNEFNDALLGQVEQVDYHFYAIENGALGFTTYGINGPNDLDIFKRICKVFDLIYQRFRDIEKAKAQAREAQIEAALERVRSVSLAMHKSEELNQVIGTVFQELNNLGFSTVQCEIILFDPEKLDCRIWPSNEAENVLPRSYHIPYNKYKFYQFLLESWQSGKDYCPYELKGMTKKAWENWLFTQTDWKHIPDAVQKSMKEVKKVFVYGATFSHGILEVGGLSRLEKGMFEIVQRVAKVFDQAFTRFLDVKKAEAQAREAQIEVSLERIRAASMAMHKSEEFSQIAVVLANQFDELDIKYAGFSINIVDPDDLSALIYVADVDLDSGQLIVTTFHTDKLKDLWIGKESLSRRTKGEDNFTLAVKGVHLDEFIEFTVDGTGTDRGLKDADLECLYYHNSFFDNLSCLGINTLEPLPDNQQKIFQKMAKTFGMSYRRFQDLQKAEGQAREAQIEAALERVRAASMAMHDSEELIKVVRILDKEIKGLGIQNIDITQIVTDFDELEKGTNVWLAIEGRDILDKYHVPYKHNYGHPSSLKFIDAVQSGAQFYTEKLSKTEKNRYIKLLFKHSDFKRTPKERQSFLLKTSGMIKSVVINKNSALIFYHYGLTEYSEEDNAIFRRFGKVFEQAYTRFLDLLKAEKQAREAQIEVALERVRARTMAMHDSSDIADTVLTFFNELTGLGLDPRIRCGVGILSESEEMQLWTASKGKNDSIALHSGSLDMTIHPLLIGVKESWMKKKSFYSYTLEGDDTKAYFKAINKATNYPVKIDLRKLPATVYQNTFIFKDGILYVFSEINFTQGIQDIFQRFSIVFGQAYTRYKDLVNAEARAREAQIQAALERVRSQSLAMHHTSELQNVINTVGEEFQKLDINNTGGVFISINEDITDQIICWGSGGTADYMEKVEIPVFNKPIYKNIINRIKGRPGFTKESFSKKEKIQFFKHMFKHPPYSNTSQEHKDRVLSKPGGYTRSCIISQHTTLFMINHEGYVFSDAENDVLKRFGHVFEQSYTRFLDLKKAEAQAREAQIVASLERVRAASMAMHHSNELSNVLSILFEQFDVLEINPSHAVLTLIDQDSNILKFRMTGKHGYQLITEKEVDLKVMDAWVDTSEKWKKSKPHSVNVNEYPPEVLPDIWELYHDMITALPEQARMRIEDFPNGLFITEGYCRFGYIGFAHNRTPTEEEKEIVARFASEFGTLYQRFLDLMKAESQTREVQIEAALERVRASSLAMHASHELKDVVEVTFNQLLSLDLPIDGCQIQIIEEDSRDLHLWSATPDIIYPVRLNIPYTENPLFDKFWSARDRGEGFISFTLTRKETIDFYDHAKHHSELGPTIDNKRWKALQSIEYGHSTSWSIQDKTGLWIFNFKNHPYNDDENLVIKRFSTVFEQAFIRFLDIKRAEEQARKAKIEAALERVRAKAMAMHSPKDLLNTVNLLLVELEGVNVHPVRCGFGRIREENKVAELFVANKTKDGRQVKLLGQPILEGHKIFEGIFNAWKDQKEYFPVLKGKLMTSYYKKLKQFMDVDIPSKGTVQYGYYNWYDETGIYAWSNTEFDEESIKIYRKFTAVLGLTFNRYQDLKDAEERAKEALREASLDRVRAEIASMRTTKDLERITPLIWKELITLEVPFFRCGVFIVNEKEEVVHTYLSTPQGESLAVLNLPFSHSELVDETVTNWRTQKIYTHNWDREGFMAFTQSIMQQGLLESAEQYQGAETPPEKLALHFVPFAQGMLYVGSEDPLTEDQLELVQSLADAFSVAYSRYEDFDNLEKAKSSLENTLKDLQAAQTQLIHSEKMASLGELTAGIAHEIQNPLNFVNNFSEVSYEIIDEAIEEMEAGDQEEAQTILQDLKSNLEKIAHHGHRASGIVKSMLDHSRASGGEKVETDINALCDEYLRLAYHGMRAKDRNFNADFKLDLDPTLPKLKVISQDIGRVLLNLINNAFQALTDRQGADRSVSTVSEMTSLKAMSSLGPLVKVSTKKFGDKIEITVSDNGPGIPDNIKDKIFQPFFTTKPTGQGTGLGLSLSYDIIKAHEGELSVTSGIADGTKFKIILKIQ